MKGDGAIKTLVNFWQVHLIVFWKYRKVRIDVWFCVKVICNATGQVWSNTYAMLLAKVQWMIFAMVKYFS